MFRTLTDRILVSPQISVEQVAEAKAQRVTMNVNNRPDDEEPGQINGAEIEAAALKAGIDPRVVRRPLSPTAVEIRKESAASPEQLLAERLLPF